MGDPSPKGKSRCHESHGDFHECIDTVSARRSLVDAAKQAAREEDGSLKAEGLHFGSSDEKIASYRGVGFGLYFKFLHWMFWMMIWMIVCSVPYLITINTSIFTDFAHRHVHKYGVKLYDTFELASITFAAIVDDRKDNGTLQYMNTDIADAWKGPTQKGVFLTWISLVDAGATVVLTGMVALLFVLVRRWLEKVDKKTREVADYAVIVCGLPPYVTATEVGEYFESHFVKDTKRDKVMDVVLISGFTTVVKSCKEVYRNEQLKRFVAGIEAKVKNTGDEEPLQSPVKAGTAAVATNAEDSDADKISLPAPPAATASPASPVAATRSRRAAFSLTAVATAADPISPRPPTSPTQTPLLKPPAASVTTLLEDPEACKNTRCDAVKHGFFMTRDIRSELAKARMTIREHEGAVMSSISGKKLQNNAALVTFNTEPMRAAVCDTMPSGWWASLIMRRDLRLEHGGRMWRLWVRPAAAPDDYRFENMDRRPCTNSFIQIFTAAVMLVLILICAALVTWISAASNKAARLPKWDVAELTAAIGVGRAKMTAASPSSAPIASQVPYDVFCGSSMGSCVAYVEDFLPDTGFNMTFGSQWTFRNATSQLLNERPLRKELLKCAEGVSCPASYCLPCYCLGLSASTNTENVTPELTSHLKSACSNYFEPRTLRLDGIMIAISVVIAVMNAILTCVLGILKRHVEKHWTITDTERSYVMWSYMVKLINSVAVLLVVNCSSFGKLQKKALDGSSSWMQRLMLDELFDDFTPEWYSSIGFIIVILMMINVAGPIIRTVLEALMKWVQRARLLYGHMGCLAAPEDYNSVFRSRQFTLEERIADVLFNVTLALLFGSGLPLCYLIAAVYLLVAFWWDRLHLLSWRQPARRYQQTLPRLMLSLLPLLVLGHCAFGLWMHTYFKAELSGMELVAAAPNARGSTTSRGISSMTDTVLARRITQPNGLALLIWFLALAVWLLCGRWILWGLFRLLGGACTRLTAFIKPHEAKENEQSDATYEEALSTVKLENMLRGPRTYRLSHLPNYRPFLTSGAAGRLWARAQGQQRFTRLTTFLVHVEMEIQEGRKKHIEQREVEMFDVADVAIKLLPNAAAALAATQAAAAAAAAALSGTPTIPQPDSLPMSPQLPMPPARVLPPPVVESSLRFPPSPPPKLGAAPAPPSPTATTTDPALVGLVPSAALQTATLQQIATLQANTGALVKHVSLRALPEALLLPGHGGSSAVGGQQMVVVPAPPLPPFELDLQHVVMRSLANLQLLPVRNALGGGGAAAAGAVGDIAGGQGVGQSSVVTNATGSEPVIRVQRSASVASATSSQVSIGTTQSAPAGCRAMGGDGSEITMAAAAHDQQGERRSVEAPEAPMAVHAEAVVLAEALPAVGSAKTASAKGNKSSGGGGVVAAIANPTAWLKFRTSGMGGGAVPSTKDSSSGPRTRGAFRFKSVPLDQLAKPAKVQAPLHPLPPQTPPPQTPPPLPLPMPPLQYQEQQLLLGSDPGEVMSPSSLTSAKDNCCLSVPGPALVAVVDGKNA